MKGKRPWTAPLPETDPWAVMLVFIERDSALSWRKNRWGVERKRLLQAHPEHPFSTYSLAVSAGRKTWLFFGHRDWRS